MSGLGQLGSALGLQWVRCNTGDPVKVRGTLRLVGCRIHDAPATRAVKVTITASARVRLDVAIPAGDYEILTPDDWAGADDVYITAEPGVRIAGFDWSPLTRYRKHVINAGTEAFEVNNYLIGMDDPAWDDPGHVLAIGPRVLAPGEACRLQFDPVTQLWLVNDGMYSSDLVSHDSSLVTHDGDNITVP